MTLDKLGAGQFAQAIISADEPVRLVEEDLCTPHDFVEWIISGQRDKALESLEKLSASLPGQYPAEGIEPADGFIVRQKSVFAMGVAEVAVRRPDMDGRLLFNLQDALDEGGFPAVTFQTYFQRLSDTRVYPLVDARHDEPLF